MKPSFYRAGFCIQSCHGRLQSKDQLLNQRQYQEVKLETFIVGTLFVVRGMCPDEHVLHWQSQPMVRGMAAGNLLLSAAVLLCNLTFTGIANLADVLNWQCSAKGGFMTY